MSTTAILRHRRGTAANFTSANPILEDGQLAFETDTRKAKLGNGAATWLSLPYVNSVPATLDALGDVSAPSPANGNALVWNSAQAQWVASAVAGGGGSVTSAAHASLATSVAGVLSAIAANSAQMVSADNAISNAVSIVSVAVDTLSAAHLSLVNRVSANSGTGGGGSVTSAEHLSVVDRLSGLSAQVTSADNAISNAVSIVSVAAAAVSADLTSVKNNLESIRSAQSAKDVSINNAISIVSVAAAGASAAAAAASAAAAGASAAAAAVSAAHTSLAASVAGALSAIAANSAQMVSADNAISNAVSIVSVAAANALSVANAASNAVSVLSNQNSVDHASIRNLVSIVSNAVSIVSVAAANALSVANAASNAVSVLSNQNSADHASIRNLVSIVSAAVATNSAQMTSANNAISNAVSIVSVAAANAASIANAVSNRLSTWTLDNLLNVSAPAPGDGQALVWNSAQAQWVASTVAGGPGGGSVTSDELSLAAAGLSVRIDSTFNAVSIVSVAVNTLSAAQVSLVNRVSANSDVATSIHNNLSDLRSDHGILSDKVSAMSAAYIAADNALSGRIDSAFGAASNYASVASNAASVASAAANVASNAASVAVAAAATIPSHLIRIVSNTQSIATSTLTKVSGMMVSLSAGETLQIEGMMLISTSAATVGLKAGVSTNVLSLPRYIEFWRVSTGQSAGGMGGAGVMQVSGTSQFLSAANLGGVLVGVNFRAILNVASAGTFRIMAAAIASATASPLHIMPGSYMVARKLK